VRIESSHRVTALAAAAALVVLPCLGAAAEEETGGAVKVASGKKISIEYTLKLDDGTEADSNVGGQPLVYQQGANQILPALEQALAGLAVNDTKHVTISAKDGYGDIDPNNVKQVALEEIPEAARKVDAVLIGVDADGNQVPVRVQKVEAEKVTLDLNHPLAGHTLNFDVKILKIE
jgi:FKBP-type peptidyl-prolyl cis-trans isomerase 2